MVQKISRKYANDRMIIVLDTSHEKQWYKDIDTCSFSVQYLREMKHSSVLIKVILAEWM